MCTTIRSNSPSTPPKDKLPASDQDYFGALPTEQQQSNPAALIHQYAPTSRQPNSADAAHSPPESNHHVTAERAYLYGTPKEDGKKMEYLISGDAVVVLDEVGDWSQIRYRQANGNEIVRWVRSADLAGGS